MEKVEKVQFILEQMRLCLAKKDYIRTQIISKKISTKFFTDTNDTVQVTTVYLLSSHVAECYVVTGERGYLRDTVPLY